MSAKVISEHRPLVLAVLDGWGYNPNSDYNAIAQANTPHWDDWWQHYPHCLLVSAGLAVGLPDEQMGNSEVGHMHLGAGRIIDQDFTRINKAITNEEFFHNDVFINALQYAVTHQKTVHVLGLLSPGGVHSHENHIHALLDLAAEHGQPKLHVHAFLDGRDTPPRSAQTSLSQLLQKMQSLQYGNIATITGRYYAMDRDNRWDRIAAAYQTIVAGDSIYQAADPITALTQAYDRGESDEFVKPTLITASQPSKINPGDVVIFMNFRADRARQFTRALVDETFDSFPRHYHPKLGQLVTLTQYAADIPAKVAFPPQSMQHTFGQCIAEHGLRQLRIAETEKYAHVTFFFNGGKETTYPGEDRVLIASPNIATYDTQPEMSAFEITAKLTKAIENKQYDVIIVNFANADMVGHSGNFAATLKAVECLDTCLGRIHQALLAVGGEMVITADHGNAEYMYDPTTKQAHTAHTNRPVPFVYLGRRATITQPQGSLIDVAPTLLYLLGIEIPAEMTGKSLVKVNTLDNPTPNMYNI